MLESEKASMLETKHSDDHSFSHSMKQDMKQVWDHFASRTKPNFVK